MSISPFKIPRILISVFVLKAINLLLSSRLFFNILNKIFITDFDGKAEYINLQ